MPLTVHGGTAGASSAWSNQVASWLRSAQVGTRARWLLVSSTPRGFHRGRDQGVGTGWDHVSFHILICSRYLLRATPAG
jgi:hypothetical protein